MGIEQSPQFKSKDGCIYVFNTIEKKWYVICPASSIPLDVKTQIQEIKEKAEQLKDC